MFRCWIFLCLWNLNLAAQWKVAVRESTAALRGVHSIGSGIVWASGANGTILRSEDDGYMWQKCSVPPGASALDFRAVYAWSGDHAAAMSIGPGKSSRIYETKDGCNSWHLLFQNPDENGFWDALSFRGNEGYILGDPVGGRFVVFRSEDMGTHWKREDSGGLSAAKQGEGAFAASNSSLVIRTDGTVLFGSGGVGGPRVFRRDRNHRWSSISVPIAGGRETAGLFSLAFRDSQHGIAVGGDFKNPEQAAGTAAWTSDAGGSWHSANVFPSGYRSSVAWEFRLQAWIAVGPNGTDLSTDDGRTWRRLGSDNWNALSLPWVVGPDGRIASLDYAFPTLAKLIHSQPLK